MRLFLIAFILLLSFIDGFSETLTYQTMKDGVEKDICYHDVVITDCYGKYSVTTYFPNESWEFVLGPGFSTIEWKYSNPDMGVDVTAVKTSNIVSIKGINKDEKYEKRVKLGHEPWIQQWDLGLRNFVISTEKKILFYTFNPMDVSIFGKFEARKLGKEKIKVNGTNVEALHVRINIEGLLALLWHGDYYFRPEDGRFILYVGKTGPIGTLDRVELVSEKE